MGTSQKTQENVLQRFCLSGEGKARITTKESRSVARYESLFDTSKGKFLFTVEVPGKGEELLEVLLPETNEEKARARGAFLQNLDLKNRKNIAHFVQKLSTVLEIYRGQNFEKFEISCQKKDESGLCLRRDEVELTWRTEADKLHVLVPGKNNNLNLLGENYASGHFQKVTMEFREGAQQMVQLKIELFLTSCK